MNTAEPLKCTPQTRQSLNVECGELEAERLEMEELGVTHI